MTSINRCTSNISDFVHPNDRTIDSLGPFLERPVFQERFLSQAPPQDTRHELELAPGLSFLFDVFERVRARARKRAWFQRCQEIEWKHPASQQVTLNQLIAHKVFDKKAGDWNTCQICSNRGWSDPCAEVLFQERLFFFCLVRDASKLCLNVCGPRGFSSLSLTWLRSQPQSSHIFWEGR